MSVNLIEKIAQDLPQASTAFARLGAFLLQSPQGFMHKPLLEIATKAQVSEPTVLRFARQYGYRGIPEFRIALAMAIATRHGTVNEMAPIVEPDLAAKSGVNRAQKTAIAAAALLLVADDRSIILDSGSTMATFARLLRAATPLTILTSGLNVVDALADARQHTLMLPAGTLRPESRSIGGHMVESTLKNMRFDTGYFGADSIDEVSGLSTFNEAEAHQSAAMMQACTRVVVLADSSKFRSPTLHHICGFGAIHAIVTDAGLAPEVAAAIEAQGTRVIRAGEA